MKRMTIAQLSVIESMQFLSMKGRMRQGRCSWHAPPRKKMGPVYPVKVTDPRTTHAEVISTSEVNRT